MRRDSEGSHEWTYLESYCTLGTQCQEGFAVFPDMVKVSRVYSMTLRT